MRKFNLISTRMKPRIKYPYNFGRLVDAEIADAQELLDDGLGHGNIVEGSNLALDNLQNNLDEMKNLATRIQRLARKEKDPDRKTYLNNQYEKIQGEIKKVQDEMQLAADTRRAELEKQLEGLRAPRKPVAAD